MENIEIKNIITDNNVKIIETNETKNETKNKQPPKTRSNFFITLNSQRSLLEMTKEISDEFKQKFTNGVEDFLNNLNSYVLVETSKTGLKYGMEKTNDINILGKLIENKIEYVMEEGPISKKLHAHIMICLEKRGINTKLDYKKIREYFNNYMGYDIHFNVKVYKDVGQNIKDYMQKSPIS